MLKTSSEYKTIVSQTGRRFYLKVVINNKEYTSVKSLTYKGGVSSSDEITFGDTLSAYVEFLIECDNSVALTGQQAWIFIGLQLTSSIEWISMGVFNIDKPKKSGRFLDITAYDNFALMEKGFYSDLKGKQKVSTILNEQCKKVGISFVGGADDVTYDVELLKGSTIREAVGILASYCGKNAVIDRNGNLKFIWFNDTDIVITSDEYSDTIEVEEQNVIINRLDCTTNDETISIGTGIGIFFSCPEMTKERLAILHNNIKGYTYRALSFDWMRARPDLEAGDVMSLKLQDGTICKVPLMDITFEYDGGFYGTIESKGKTEIEQEHDFKSPTDRKFDFVYEEILSVNKLLAGTIDAWEGNFETINTNYLNVNGKLTALEGQFNDLKSTTITTTYLESNYAKIDLTNIKDGSITTAMIGTGVVGNAQIADGSITDGKIVTLTANKITAGTLDASEIEVINLKASNITVGTINGHQIADSAIDWDKLTSQVTGTINQAGSTASEALDEAMKAYQEALTASDKASSAQSTADGKNTVFYQSTAPSLTGRKRNDIWYDTDDGNKMYFFNGSAWVSVQFGASAIGNNVISADKIASDVNNKISQAFNNAGLALDGINGLEVGGRNLLVNHYSTYFSHSNMTISNGSNLNSNYGDGIEKYKKITALANTTSAYFYFPLKNYIKETGIYTFSFYAKSDKEISFKWISINNASVISNNTTVATKLNTKYFRVIVVFKIFDTQINASNFNIHWMVGGNSALLPFTIYYHSMKLEKGNKATDWTPAPEDVQSSIDNAQLTADKTLDKLNNWAYTNSTLIDGGKIFTGSITALQIASRTITADKLVAKTITATSGIIADAAILTANIADLAVTGAKIANATIGTAKIANAAITTALIADAAINNAKIANIDAGKITTGVLSADRIAANAIVAGKIAANAITTANLQSNSITGEKISANAITAIHINANTITGDKLVVSTITGDKIASKSITSTHIVANSITSAEISAGAITTSELASGAVTAAKITAGTITAVQIASNTITADKLATNAIVSRNYVYNSTGSFLNLSNGAFYSKNLKWDSAGTLSATNVNINGTITSTAGSIGGWTIGSQNLSAEGSGFLVVLRRPTSINHNGTGDNDVLVVRNGTSGNYSYPVVISSNGTVTFTNANISGTITGATISGGTITGTAIKGGTITSGTTINVNTDLTVGNNIYINQSVNSIKSIKFNTDNYVQNVWTNSYNYLKLNSGYRVAMTCTVGGVTGSSVYAAQGEAGITADRIKMRVSNGRMEMGDQGVELYGNTPYIDFHQNYSSSDYTSRIIDTGYLELLKPSSGIKFVSGDTVLYLEGNGIGDGRCFRPQGANNNQVKLGATYAGFYRLYASLSNYTTSDIRKKTNIKEYDSRFESMYMDLKPITYELISDRGQSHCGFIAQWTKEAMLKNKILDSEFGVYIHENDEYGMAYEEMVSLNTHMIQKTILRVNKHDEEISKLKDEIKQLQAKLNAYENETMEVRTWQA